MKTENNVKDKAINVTSPERLPPSPENCEIRIKIPRSLLKSIHKRAQKWGIDESDFFYAALELGYSEGRYHEKRILNYTGGVEATSCTLPTGKFKVTVVFMLAKGRRSIAIECPPSTSMKLMERANSINMEFGAYVAGLFACACDARPVDLLRKIPRQEKWAPIGVYASVELDKSEFRDLLAVIGSQFIHARSNKSKALAAEMFLRVFDDKSQAHPATRFE